jgi:hypothetical protein
MAVQGLVHDDGIGLACRKAAPVNLCLGGQ